MKKVKWLFGCLLIVFFGLAATLPSTRAPMESGKILYTANMPWRALRTPAAETGAAAYDFTAANGGWSDICVDTATIAATNGLVDVMGVSGDGWGGNGIEIAFYANDPKDAANDTFDFEIFAYADSLYGPAVKVYATSGNANAVGTRICTTNPVTGAAQAAGLWVDTIAGTDYWDGVTISNSGNNSIAILRFDLRGYRYVWLRTFNQGGGGTEAALVGAIYRLY